MLLILLSFTNWSFLWEIIDFYSAKLSRGANFYICNHKLGVEFQIAPWQRADNCGSFLKEKIRDTCSVLCAESLYRMFLQYSDWSYSKEKTVEKQKFSLYGYDIV